MEPLLRPNGWKGQAERLVTNHTTLGAKIAVTASKLTKPSSPKLRAVAAETPNLECGAIPETRELEREHELAAARSLIAGLERRLAREAATNRALSEQVETLAATAEDASQRANKLEDAINTIRNSQEQADLPMSADPSGLVTETEAALKDTRGKIQFLEAALDAAEHECALREDEAAAANERLRSESGAFKDKLESMATRIADTEGLLMDVSALRDKLESMSDRITSTEKLVTNMSAFRDKLESMSNRVAGTEKLVMNMSAFRDKLESMSDRVASTEKLVMNMSAFRDKLESMSDRVASTETLLTDLRQHFLASHLGDTATEVTAPSGETKKENEQLAALLRLTLLKVKQLERSRAALFTGIQSVSKAFADCDTAQVLEHMAISLVERRSDPQPERQTKVAETSTRGANGGFRERADWVELATLLTQLIKRKDQSSERTAFWSLASS
jgi:chromosome segregation ATPase